MASKPLPTYRATILDCPVFDLRRFEVSAFDASHWARDNGRRVADPFPERGRQGVVWPTS
jgi:hypothetical protein